MACGARTFITDARRTSRHVAHLYVRSVSGLVTWSTTCRMYVCQCVLNVIAALMDSAGSRSKSVCGLWICACVTRCLCRSTLHACVLFSGDGHARVWERRGLKRDCGLLANSALMESEQRNICSHLHVITDARLLIVYYRTHARHAHPKSPLVKTGRGGL